MVPVAHELARGLGALGEHEHELLLVVQEPQGVVGMRRHAAGARPERADDGHGAEDVVAQAVDRASELLLDPVHDDRRVRRDRAAVVAHEQRASLAWHVLESLPLHPEPMAVDGVVGTSDEIADPLAATPGVDAGPVDGQGRTRRGAADGYDARPFGGEPSGGVLGHGSSKPRPVARCSAC